MIEVAGAGGAVLRSVGGDGAGGLERTLLLRQLLFEARERMGEEAEPVRRCLVVAILQKVAAKSRGLGAEPGDVVLQAFLSKGDTDSLSGGEIDLINTLGDRNGAVPELVSE